MKHLVIVRHANPLSQTDTFAIAEALGRIGTASPAPKEEAGVTKWVVEHSHDPDAAAVALNAAATKASWSADSVTVTPYVVRGPAPASPASSEAQEAFRSGLIGAISAYSEEHYSAGWLIGIEQIVREQADPYFTVLAYLAGGFPRFDDSHRTPGASFEDSLVWDALTDDERSYGAALVAELTDSRTDPNS